ncbi:MAG: tyrosine-type recombinase/integrase [Bryobacteraceae bacterium]
MAYGSGTLFPRGKKGIWYYQAWVNGKQIGPFSAKTIDKKKARHELDKLLGKRARGEVTGLKRDKLTVGDSLQDYMVYADEKLENAKGIRYKLEAHIVPHRISGILASNLTSDDLRKYRSDRTNEGAKETTCNREIAYLRAALNRALREGKISALPYFPMTKEENARQGFLYESDFLTLLEEMPYPLKPFAACGYYTGMRRGELLRLEPGDVDLKRGFITIRKTKRGLLCPRAVPIFDGPMREWLTWALCERGSENKKLFVWEDGRPFTERNFYDAWHAAARRAAVPWYIPHDSRRSANRNLRNAGVSQKLRMEVIGHTTDHMDRRYGIVDLHDVNVVKEIMARKPL